MQETIEIMVRGYIPFIANIGVLTILVYFVSFLRLNLNSDPSLTSVPRSLKIGMLFGAAAAILINIPFEFEPGIIADARGAPILLSGVIGGPVAALVSTFIAAITRYYSGGSGMIGGVIYVFIFGLAGVVLHISNKRKKSKSPITFKKLVLLSTFATVAASPVIFLFPQEIRFQVLLNIWPKLYLANIIGLLVLGLMIKRDTQESEAQYLSQSLFEKAEVSIWNEDFSEVLISLRKLKNDGVTDLRGFLVNNKEVAIEIANSVKVKQVNEATLKMFKAESEQQMLGSIEKVFVEDSIDVFIEQLCAIWNKERVFRSEATQRTLNGETLVVLLSVPIPETEAGFKSIPVSIIDITERKKTEESLRLNEERLRLTTEKVGVAIWEYHVDDNSMTRTENHDQLYGLTNHKDWSIETFQNATHPDDRIYCNNIIRESLSPGGPENYSFDFRVVWPNKEVHWLSVVGQIYARNKKGYAKIIRGCLFDISKRKKQEELFIRTQKMNALGRLTGGVAHDYNNMLGVISGYAELLEKKLFDQPDLIKNVQTIRRAASRGAKLTKKLLGFSRQSEIHKTRININEILNNDRDMLVKTLTVRVQLELILADDIWPVTLDENDLQDAIINMSINAMHAIDGTGKLTMRTKNSSFNSIEATPLGLEVGEYVQLDISDTGRGMDKATQERIFEPFYSTKGEQGTGLGLSQVYGFVERSAGAITVYSELGIGTRISMYFPRFEGADEISRPQGSDVQKSLAGKGTVLIVDDEPELASLASEILEQNGYKSICVESGEQALAVLEQKPIDFMLSDVIMPGMSGSELAIIVKDKYPSVRIQLASGFIGQEHQKVGYFAEGHAKVLNKPYSFDALLESIKNLRTSY